MFEAPKFSDADVGWLRPPGDNGIRNAGHPPVILFKTKSGFDPMTLMYTAQGERHEGSNGSVMKYVRMKSGDSVARLNGTAKQHAAMACSNEAAVNAQFKNVPPDAIAVKAWFKNGDDNTKKGAGKFEGESEKTISDKLRSIEREHLKRGASGEQAPRVGNGTYVVASLGIKTTFSKTGQPMSHVYYLLMSWDPHVSDLKKSVLSPLEIAKVFRTVSIAQRELCRVANMHYVDMKEDNFNIVRDDKGVVRFVRLIDLGSIYDPSIPDRYITASEHLFDANEIPETRDPARAETLACWQTLITFMDAVCPTDQNYTAGVARGGSAADPVAADFLNDGGEHAHIADLLRSRPFAGGRAASDTSAPPERHYESIYNAVFDDCSVDPGIDGGIRSVVSTLWKVKTDKKYASIAAWQIGEFTYDNMVKLFDAAIAASTSARSKCPMLGWELEQGVIAATAAVNVAQTMRDRCIADRAPPNIIAAANRDVAAAGTALALAVDRQNNPEREEARTAGGRTSSRCDVGVDYSIDGKDPVEFLKHMQDNYPLDSYLIAKLLDVDGECSAAGDKGHLVAGLYARALLNVDDCSFVDQFGKDSNICDRLIDLANAAYPTAAGKVPTAFDTQCVIDGPGARARSYRSAIRSFLCGVPVLAKFGQATVYGYITNVQIADRDRGDPDDRHADRWPFVPFQPPAPPAPRHRASTKADVIAKAAQAALNKAARVAAEHAAAALAAYMPDPSPWPSARVMAFPMGDLADAEGDTVINRFVDTDLTAVDGFGDTVIFPGHTWRGRFTADCAADDPLKLTKRTSPVQCAVVFQNGRNFVLDGFNAFAMAVSAGKTMKSMAGPGPNTVSLKYPEYIDAENRTITATYFRLDLVRGPQQYYPEKSKADDALPQSSRPKDSYVGQKLRYTLEHIDPALRRDWKTVAKIFDMYRRDAASTYDAVYVENFVTRSTKVVDNVKAILNMHAAGYVELPTTLDLRICASMTRAISDTAIRPPDGVPPHEAIANMIRAWFDRGVSKVFFPDYSAQLPVIGIPTILSRNMNRDVVFFAPDDVGGAETGGATNARRAESAADDAPAMETMPPSTAGGASGSGPSRRGRMFGPRLRSMF